MILRRNYFLLLFFSTALFLTSCSDDDDAGTPPVVNPTGSLEVGDQAVVNGMVTIENVEVSDDSWIVIFRDNAGTQDTEILGQTHVDAGSHDNVTIDLGDTDLTEGETLWAALHVDKGEPGIFDWDGTMGADVAIKSGNANVTRSFTVNLNSLTVEDQAVVDNTITISNVVLEGDGWIVVHADSEGAPGAVIGVSELITAGSHDNVVITFDESAEVSVGDDLWIMLHEDTGVAGEYEFDGESEFDHPLTGDDDAPIMTSITITEEEEN